MIRKWRFNIRIYFKTLQPIDFFFEIKIDCYECTNDFSLELSWQFSTFQTALGDVLYVYCGVTPIHQNLMGQKRGV